MTKNKVHMGNSSSSERVRCGQFKKNVCWAPHDAPSGVTCKSCLRFYNGDIAKEMSGRC